MAAYAALPEVSGSRRSSHLVGQRTIGQGFGEMDSADLWDTTMNPETRTLMQVNIEDQSHAEAGLERLMGSEVQPRKRFITEYARNVKNLDI